MIIRKAQVEDAQAIIDHVNQIAGESTYHTLVFGELDQDLEDQVAYIEAVLQSTNCLMAICEVDGDLVGIMTVDGGNRSKTRHWGNLGISLKKAHTGQGYGSKLMAYLEDWIKQPSTEIEKVNLVVHEKNTRAIVFYEYLGYNPEGCSTGYFKEGTTYYNGLHMGKWYTKV